MSSGFCPLNAPKTILLRSSVWGQVVRILSEARSNAPAMMSNMLGQLAKQRSVLFSIVYVWEREGHLVCYKSQHIQPLCCLVLCYISTLEPDLSWPEQLSPLKLPAVGLQHKIQLFLQHSGPNLQHQDAAEGDLGGKALVFWHMERKLERARGQDGAGGRWRCRHCCWASGAWSWATPRENQLHK